jgi:purine catabolism regulator
MTVRAALELPALRRGLPTVVAGEAQLDRPVRWVHPGEVAHIASLLRGGELLMTTGMGIGSRPADQRRFVAELAEREVAGLIIELGERFRHQLPKAILSAADKAGLPTVVLHTPVPFVDVTEAIHTAIVNGHYEMLRQASALQDRFTALMLQGGGVRAVLDVLVEALGNPVLLEAGDGRLLAWSAPTLGGDRDPVAAWRDAGDLGISATVATPSGQSGRLISLPLARELDAFAPLALERAAGVVALALLRSRQEEELLALGRGDVLRRLARGELAAHTAAAHARTLGFTEHTGGALLPLVARLTTQRDVSLGSAWTAVLPELERALSTVGSPVLSGLDPGPDELLLLISLRAPSERSRAAEAAARAVGDLVERRLGGTVIVAAGGASGWEHVDRGLRIASETASVARRLPPQPWHDATTMPLDRLLWRLREHDQIGRYVEELLGPVLEHDRTSRHPLLPTLEVLCLHAGRRAEAARALHLNRQALYDRIARLEQLVGRDLNDPAVLLAYGVAVRARSQRT